MINKKYKGLYYETPMFLGYIFLAILFSLVFVYLFNKPLVSPVGSEIIPQVHAQEIIMCEKGVKEYLECKVVNGELTENQGKIMLAIAKAESNLNEKARNPKSTARGVFQIIASTWYNYDCVGDKYNFKDNTNCAIKIMKRSGYTPWEVYNKKSYLKYL